MGYTKSEMKAIAEENGSHWFDEKTMAFFNSVVETSGNHENLFLTSEQFNEDVPRFYTVRYFNPEDGKVTTVGDFAKLDYEEAVELRKGISTALRKHAGNREKDIMKHLATTEINESGEVEFLSDFDHGYRKFCILPEERKITG